MRDFRDAKAMARTLRAALVAKDAEISHGEALELVARMLGERDWNTLSAAIDTARRREATWTRLETHQASQEAVMGSIVGRVRGGFSVDLGGVTAFLPGTQVDVRPVRDYAPLMACPQPFAILKMDRPAGAVVISRRAVLARSDQRS